MSNRLNNTPLRIAWLCHFANDEMKKYFKTPHINEFAQWISKLLELMKDNNAVELYVVAPNVFTNRDCEFTKDNITYLFYKPVSVPYNNKLIKRVYYLLQIETLTNYFWIKKKIVRIIQKINPDIIHLHGAENSYYSAGILPLIERYAVFVTIQGFRRNSSYMNYNIKKMVEIEEDIIKKAKHIGVRTDEMSRIVKQINSDVTLHFHNYPIEMPNILKDNIGKDEPIDCLFFARIDKDKGIEDLLAAISIVKKSFPKISVNVIGSTGTRYQSYLRNVCIKLNIVENVHFIGFLPSQEAIYEYILQAKMCVLPTYHDIMPGTIVISMFMKLPVVAYAVGGIPELNKEDETVALVEKRNIIQLAERIIQLLNDDEFRKILAEKAYTYASERFDNSKVIPDILNAYRKILEDN